MLVLQEVWYYGAVQRNGSQTLTDCPDSSPDVCSIRENSKLCIQTSAESSEAFIEVEIVLN